MIDAVLHRDTQCFCGQTDMDVSPSGEGSNGVVVSGLEACPTEVVELVLREVALDDLAACAHACRRLEAVVLSLLATEAFWKLRFVGPESSVCWCQWTVYGSCEFCCAARECSGLARRSLLFVSSKLGALLSLRDGIVLPERLGRREVGQFCGCRARDISWSRPFSFCLIWKELSCRGCLDVSRQPLWYCSLEDGAGMRVSCEHSRSLYLDRGEGHSFSFTLDALGLGLCLCSSFHCDCLRYVELRCFVATELACHLSRVCSCSVCARFHVRKVWSPLCWRQWDLLTVCRDFLVR